MNSRRKGHDYEREIAEALRCELGVKAERNLEYQGGHSNRDIETPHWSIQCKCVKRHSRPVIAEGFRQAMRGADVAHPVPVLFLRENRACSGSLPDLVVMGLFDWLNLVREWNTGGERLVGGASYIVAEPMGEGK